MIFLLHQFKQHLGVSLFCKTLVFFLGCCFTCVTSAEQRSVQHVELTKSVEQKDRVKKGQVEISPNFQAVNISGVVDYLEDTHRAYQIEEIINGQYDHLFINAADKRYSPGISTSAYWLRFTIIGNDLNNPPNALEGNYSLEISNSLIDFIELYEENENNAYTLRKGGDRYPHARRELNYRSEVFHFSLHSNQKKTFYLRLQSDSSSVGIGLHLRSAKGFVETKILTQLVRGLFYGAMLAMSIYNLFLFVAVRDKSYLYYVVFIVCTLLYRASLDGYVYQYFLSDQTVFFHSVINTIFALPLISAVIFSRHFLNTRETTPTIDKILLGNIYIVLLIMLTNKLVPFTVYANLVMTMGIISPLCIAGAGIYNWANGNSTGKYFCIAWSCFNVGVIVHVLMQAGLVPQNFLTVYSLQIGSLVDVLLLSFALADRINIVQKEKELLQESALTTLEASNKLKDEFLATVSHELRTPMNGVEGAIDLLKTTHLDPEQINYVDTADNSATHMMDLIDSLLDFTEGQANRITVEEKPFSIRSMLDELEQQLLPKCKHHNLKLNIAIDQDVPDLVVSDVTRVQQLLNHLSDNAVKFTHEGQVTIRVSSTPDVHKHNVFHIVFAIEDTGKGIPKESQEAIFQSFSQEDSSFKRQYGGLGIGLSICKKLVEIMGGELTFKSNVGLGTVFHLCLPLKLANAKDFDKTKITINNSPIDPANITVLVVEDNMINQKVMIGILKKLGYKTLMADNGENCLKIIENQAVDIILMDCQMPVMDGIEATEHLKAEGSPYRDVPIIAVTANALGIDKERCFNAGMNDYLRKPVKKDVVEKKLKFWLNQANYQKDKAL